jgi:hypothetical protein
MLVLGDSSHVYDPPPQRRGAPLPPDSNSNGGSSNGTAAAGSTPAPARPASPSAEASEEAVASSSSSSSSTVTATAAATAAATTSPTAAKELYYTRLQGLVSAVSGASPGAFLLSLISIRQDSLMFCLCFHETSTRYLITSFFFKYPPFYVRMFNIYV